MTRAEIAIEVKKIIFCNVDNTEHIGNFDDLQEDDIIADNLGADSLDRVEIDMQIEGCFFFEIPEQVAEKLKTVGDYIDYVYKKTRR